MYLSILAVQTDFFISKMSWGHVENPKKVFKVGDHVKALIKDIDWNKDCTQPEIYDTNPWKDAESKYAVGNACDG